MILLPQQLYDREKILESCLAVFAHHGYKNTSTGMLAEAAGISKALIFHHFKSKKKLYFNLLEYCYEKGGRVFLMDTVLKDGDFFQAVRISMKKKFEYYRKNSNESKLVYEAFYLTPDELKEELEERYGDVFQEKNQLWEKLFAQVSLQSGVKRSEAMEFIMMTLERHIGIAGCGRMIDHCTFCNDQTYFIGCSSFVICCNFFGRYAIRGESTRHGCHHNAIGKM
jgi:TetR/AcrR family transcriptional regulator